MAKRTRLAYQVTVEADPPQEGWDGLVMIVAAWSPKRLVDRVLKKARAAGGQNLKVTYSRAPEYDIYVRGWMKQKTSWMMGWERGDNSWGCCYQMKVTRRAILEKDEKRQVD